MLLPAGIIPKRSPIAAKNRKHVFMGLSVLPQVQNGITPKWRLKAVRTALGARETFFGSRALAGVVLGAEPKDV